MEDLARTEPERGECLSVLCNKEKRGGLSQCIVPIMASRAWQASPKGQTSRDRAGLKAGRLGKRAQRPPDNAA